jgi:hypothetical protein
MNKYFTGVVLESKYAQIIDLVSVPLGVNINGVFNQTGVRNDLYVGHYIEKRYVFEGVPASLAKALPDSVEVSDINGDTHTVSFKEGVNNSSGGTAVFENYNNAIIVSKLSPHLRTVEVVETRGELYCNNEKVA